MPADLEYLARIRIEPFDDSRHDRESFSCGVDRLDNFLKITASKYVKDDNGRIYVAVEENTRRVVGFHAINPHAIDASEFDEKTRKRFPSGRERISAFYLSMFARDLSVRGKGLGPLLLADVFKRCLGAADIAGGRFIVLDALDERAEQLYASMGFQALPGQPRKMVISIAKVRNSAAAAASADKAS